MSTVSTDGEGGSGRSAPYGRQQPSTTWVSGAGSSRRRSSEGSRRLSDDNFVPEPAAQNNNAVPPPPISGQIPSPTGGIHSYQTEDRLRHRSLITTPTRHSGYFLDDADIAAGSIDRRVISKCLSEPRPPSAPRETLRNRANARTDISSSSISMDGGAYGGSEHDGLLLESSHSVLDNNFSEDYSYKGKPLHANITIPSAVDDTISSPISNNNKFVVLGWDLSQNTRQTQFLISAGGTFCFSLLYGYLQELISVELCNRKLGLFLAAAQFTAYTILSYFFRNLDKGVNVNRGVGGSSAASGMSFSRRLRRLKNWGRLRDRSAQSAAGNVNSVPIELYVGLSVLRAIDLGMTNLAMQYVNYPAKTLMKSTRVVFTMLFGVIITKKRYSAADYGIVCLMVAGLALFMHADSTSSAVFQPVGIVMLTISLLCDGAISNMSEAIMNKYSVGQDEFIFRLYSIALFFVCIAASANGDLRQGLVYLTTPGTLKEMNDGLEPTWSIHGKILTMVLFSTTGFFGSSCSAAITKSFGALTMSITSTARKATTIFLSFALFPNECTSEHIFGIVLFIASLVTKSLRASTRGHHHQQKQRYAQVERDDISQDVVNDCGSISLAPLRLKMRGKLPAHDIV